jgi:hypothetical protein
LKEIRTTKKDFALFVSFCKEWADLFSLGDWDIDYLHESDKNKPESISTTTANMQQHHATIRMDKIWPKVYLTSDQLKRIALHEILEIVLMELRILGESRFLADGEIDRVAHIVIQRISNLILESIS